MPSCFLFSKEDMVYLPSWVQIFGLPADCWTGPALSKIASVVGKPIHTDMLTISKKGANYARVLVEIDAKKPRAWEYTVQLPTGKKTLVKFKFELEPKFCSICNSLGHVEDLCGVKGRTKNIPTHPRQWKTTQHHAPAADVQMDGTKAAGPSNTKGDEPECSRTKDCTIPVIPETKHLYSDLDKNSNSHDNGGGLKSTASCSSNMEPTPSYAVGEQQTTVRTETSTIRGKEAADNIPACGDKQRFDFSDDDLLSCDGTDRPMLHEDDCTLDSDDLDDILSRVRIQDGED